MMVRKPMLLDSRLGGRLRDEKDEVLFDLMFATESSLESRTRSLRGGRE